MTLFNPLPPRTIRLLDLLPANSVSPFRGNLREVSLDSPTVYEALSYTWGAPEESSILHCGSNTIPLTLNLQLALSRLRFNDRIRTLWIDQICINQNDILERGQQVGLMGDIYRRAEVVNIWIGEEDEETPFVIDAIGRFMECFPNTESTGPDEEEIPNVIQTLGLLFVKSGVWIALRNFFERPYFRRMWIVQEVVLGRKCMVYCGSRVMDWEELAKAASCLDSDVERQLEAHRVIQMIRGLRTGSENRSLLRLLGQTYNLLCTNPRDKVYGVLGLASDIDEGDVVPNYLLTCQEVYISITKYCVKKYGSLGVLSCVRNPKTLSDLPSWVPDWNVVSEVGQCLCFRASEKYLVAGTSTSQYRFSPDDLILYAIGRKMDFVKTLGTIMPGLKEEDSDVHNHIEHEWEQLARTVSPYHTGETHPTIFWRTCLADGQTRGSDSDETRQRLWESHHYLVSRNREMGDRKKYKLEVEQPDEMSVVNSRSVVFSALFEASSYGRRLAITEEGYLGLVPAETQASDCVCIFAGVQVPFVVRKREEGNGYILIGECYFQGWMDGKLYEESSNPILEFEIY